MDRSTLEKRLADDRDKSLFPILPGARIRTAGGVSKNFQSGEKIVRSGFKTPDVGQSIPLNGKKTSAKEDDRDSD
jgi:hypothetical protein